MDKITYIIPCYNSEAFLEGTVDKLKQVIKDNLSSKYQCEIILINDNSKDRTIDVIKKIIESSCEECEIIGIDLARNFGQHSALMAGFMQATGDIIVCMDDDGQTPPEESCKLISEINDEVDVVYAKYGKKKHSAYRNLGSKVNDFMAEHLLSKPKNLTISSFFAMKKYVKDEILKYENPYPYMEGLMLRTTDKIKNVEVNHKERKYGKSNYSIKKLLKLWMNGFTNFSVKPLRIAIVFSVLFIIMAFILAVIIGINKINNPDVPIGWSSTIIVLLMIGSSITFILGLIGEYVGRIYISINNNPQYVIRQVIMKNKGN